MTWDIGEDIKYKEEVKEIIESITPRILEICEKFEKGNVNMASLPAFFLGIQGDIDDGLRKVLDKKGKMYCAIKGCGKIDETHSAYCIKHGRSLHKIHNKEGRRT